jgi:hypothetical protein
MKKKTCPFEDKVAASLRRNMIDPEVEKHAAECPVCEEVMFIQGWMNQYKRVSWDVEAAEKKLPGPEEMWSRSRLRRRRDRKFVKRALRPVIFSQVFVATALVFASVFFVLANLPGLGNFLQSKPEANTLVHAFSPLVKTASVWLPLVFIPLAIILVSMGFISMITALEDRKRRLT